MAATFSRTLRSLQRDRLPWGLAGVTSLLIMPAALAWMLFAEITVYEVSSQARLEVMASPSSIATVVEGRVVQSNLQVGNQTVEGDVLVVLDGEAVVRAIEERRQHSTAVRAHRTALLAEIQAEEQAIAAEAKARVQAVEESRAKLAEAEVRARFAQQSLERAVGPGFDACRGCRAGRRKADGSRGNPGARQGCSGDGQSR